MKKLLIIFVIFFLFYTLSVNTVKADIAAPGEYVSSGLISNNTKTNISMVYENVSINISEIPEDIYELSGGYTTCDIYNWENDTSDEKYYSSQVEASFLMKNNSDKSVNTPVVFPLYASEFPLGEYKPGRPTYDYSWKEPGLFNFTVNGNLLNSDITTASVNIDGKIKEISVYAWEESFEPNEQKIIAVSYDYPVSCYMERLTLTYILATGGTWDGPIGGGIIEFTLPENLLPYSFLPSLSDMDGGSTAIPYTLRDNKVIFSFNNYKPKDDIIAISVIHPETFREIEEKESLPKTSRNLADLSSAYADITWGMHVIWFYKDPSILAKTYARKAVSSVDNISDLHYVLNEVLYQESYPSVLNFFDPQDCENGGHVFFASIFEDDYKACLYETAYRGIFSQDGSRIHPEEDKDLFALIYYKAKELNDTELVNAMDVFFTRQKEVEQFLSENKQTDISTPSLSEVTSSHGSSTEIIIGITILCTCVFLLFGTLFVIILFLYKKTSNDDNIN